MIKCHDIENLLPLYSEGVLSDAEKRAVEEHLSGCAACRKELAYLQQASQLVNHLSPVEEPPWFQQKIMTRVREEADKKSFAQKWFYPLRIKIPVQIAATLVIAVLAVYIYRSGDEQVKDILPGVRQPAREMQNEQAPAPMPQAGDRVLSRPAVGKKADPREDLKKDKAVSDSIAAGRSVQESEVSESKPGIADEVDGYRVKGLAESKDEARGGLQVKQNESARPMPMPQMAEQEKKAADRALPTLEKRKESSKMAAPSAPQSGMASAVAPLQARVLVRVDDPDAAALDVEKILVQSGAKKMTKQQMEREVVIQAEVSGKDWQDVLTEIKKIGQVEEKVMPADIGGRKFNVVIEISGR